MGRHQLNRTERRNLSIILPLFAFRLLSQFYFRNLAFPAMGECGELRAWDELIPDTLGIIFGSLSLQEKLTVVPSVCKPWAKAVSGPYCWQEIDIKEWSQRCKPEQLDRMLRLLMARSGGTFKRLSVSGLRDDAIFSFIADHAGSLQALELPGSEISDAIVEQVTAKLSNLTFLDVSYCKPIGPRGLEAFGKHCKSLTRLRRTMRPLGMVNLGCQDDEASAIASTMPKLRQLEVAYLHVTCRGILDILSKCKDLESLDIRGCWDVRLDEKFFEENHAGLRVLGPGITDHCYESNCWGECSDFSDSSMYTWEFLDDGIGVFEGMSDDDDGGWDDEPELEGLEVRFYGGGIGDALVGFEWPPSP